MVIDNIVSEQPAATHLYLKDEHRLVFITSNIDGLLATAVPKAQLSHPCLHFYISIQAILPAAPH
jgi:hypothetical protein